jgi:hypothetical protein
MIGADEVLARSPYPDDQTIAREWQRRSAEEEMDHPEWSDAGRSRFAAEMTLAAIVVGCIVVWALAVYGGGHLAGWW